MKLQRTFLRTLVADGKYELAEINFFNPETQEIIVNSNCGWLESNTADLHKLNLPTCKRKIKLDLSVKIPFILKNKDAQFYFDRDKYVLYIPTTLVNFKDLGEQVRFESKTDKSYYVYYEAEVEGATSIEADFSTFTVQLYKYTKRVNKDFGNEVILLKTKFEELGIGIQKYEVEKLLENFNVTQK